MKNTFLKNAFFRHDLLRNPFLGYYSGIRAFEWDSSSSSIDRVWKGLGSLWISSSLEVTYPVNSLPIYLWVEFVVF